MWPEQFEEHMRQFHPCVKLTWYYGTGGVRFYRNEFAQALWSGWKQALHVERKNRAGS